LRPQRKNTTTTTTTNRVLFTLGCDISARRIASASQQLLTTALRDDAVFNVPGPNRVSTAPDLSPMISRS
jgi:hypothetical protein